MGIGAAWVTHRNVDRLDVSLYRLPMEEFGDLLFGGLVDVNYVPPDPQHVWSQSVSVAAELNTTAYRRFEIVDEAGNQLEPGLYFITLDSPQIDQDAAHLQAHPLVMATANVTLKTTATEALAWVTDLDQDGLSDLFEQQIIDADPNDAIVTLEDVR